MQITHDTLDTNPGPSDWFTGTVYIDTIAVPSPPSRVGAALVHFAPARAPPGTRTPTARRSTSPKASAAASAKALPSRRSDPATVSTSTPARTTGTVPSPTGS